MSDGWPGRIALSGKSGSGKTTVAAYLRDEHGYSLISTGILCRRLCEKHLGRYDQQTLHGVAALVRELDPSFWIMWALKQCESQSRVVIDSIRYQADLPFVRERGFAVWRVDAEQEVRRRRLASRGQPFVEGRDEAHAVETDLDEEEPDVRLANSGEISDLFLSIGEVLGQVPSGSL
jgi:dephospho-CoA kinase